MFEYKYFHFVVISKFYERAVAYHHASLNPDDVSLQWRSLNERARVPGSLYSIHMLKTAGSDFKAVQERDPYFDNFEVFEDLDEFLDTVYHLAQQANAI
ncbi:hypothetical protein [Levilactobacillus parabrevis]|uniref:hypothetical protein n=1 Tax=Levilactobacillus parabrevis TaxID=357278 RepID=UPI0021A780DB|nr:hypothetical protein [Levilactobacillus parabrevis]MCT4487696.1 hypothetical protein [Levilactobacillus parabrevis]MCT4490684.1 hypothetical protein [Levilactobacillus parabrevis]